MRTRVFVAALALTFVGASALTAEPVAKPEVGPEAKPATKPETKPEADVDPEGEAKLRELAAKLNEALLGKSEPVKCYRLLPEGQITVGQAVEVCGGTTDAVKTVQCFEEAWGPLDEGGLGLNLGQAVRLCKTAQAAARD
jgi:hypothetical protein